jgi:hypothetical protein
MTKIRDYRAFFQREGLPFQPVAFIGMFEGRHYPDAYTEEEKELVGLSDEGRFWMHQVLPHIYRIRNFRGVPCTAGQKSVYITKEGVIKRCLYDRERTLEHPLETAEPCGVGACGCGMLLENMSSVDDMSLTNYWALKVGLPPRDTEWMVRLARTLGYSQPNDAIAAEMVAMYDALMEAYGKDEFPEE